MRDERSATAPALVALSLAFVLSGAAALIFETLWFRLAGLVFGNSSWASAIVLGSFMTGLAIGNALSPRLVRPPRHPLHVYAALEMTVAATGLLLVFLLPSTASILAPVFRHVMSSAAILNGARLLFAFAFLAIPATVMGATLPAMVKALSPREPNFGRLLGLLYGCNTIGAVAGSLAGELLLVRLVGVPATGAIAAMLSLSAASVALAVRRSLPPVPEARAEWRALNRRAIRLLIAASCAGFSLLALEVIWFRFTILFIFATAIAFAVMLATVLLGIGAGGLAASAVLSRFADADRYVPLIAAASGMALVLSYSGFAPMPMRAAGFIRREEMAMIIDALRLMLPTSFFSGVLFTFIGRGVERELGEESRAAALLTFANTVGAAVGPLIAAFVFIPTIGIERSLFAIALLYAIVFLLTLRGDTRRLPVILAAGALATTVALFPFGLLSNYFLPIVTRPFSVGSHVVAVREGPIETAVCLRTDYAGQPYSYRLFTNGYSMSATTFPSKRYMSLFVYLPLALRPAAHRALLISYGVGMTARRLSETRQLESIDIVDISRTILSLSGVVWAGQSDPLRDPRVRLHVEDGRFFLLTTDQRFDLITGEPPPPKAAGIVNLYTREYFHLLHDRLTDDGIASYWLPVYQLTPSDTKSIIAAFCDAFSDCSAWSGAGAEWILVGSRGARGAPSAEDFSRQWRDPIAGEVLRRLGVEKPEQLAALFIADAHALHRYAGDRPPVTDDYPLRLSPRAAQGIDVEYLRLMNAAPDSFARSTWLRKTLPESIRAEAFRWFAPERLIDAHLLVPVGPRATPSPALLRAILTTTSLRTLPRLMFDVDGWLEDIALRARARGDRDPSLAYMAAIGALSDRDYHRAAQLFGEARRGLPGDRELPGYEALALSLAR